MLRTFIGERRLVRVLGTAEFGENYFYFFFVGQILSHQVVDLLLLERGIPLNHFGGDFQFQLGRALLVEDLSVVLRHLSALSEINDFRVPVEGAAIHSQELPLARASSFLQLVFSLLVEAAKKGLGVVGDVFGLVGLVENLKVLVDGEGFFSPDVFDLSLLRLGGQRVLLDSFRFLLGYQLHGLLTEQVLELHVQRLDFAVDSVFELLQCSLPDL